MAELENKKVEEEAVEEKAVVSDKKEKKAAAKKAKTSFKEKFVKFFKDNKSELKKIVWYGKKATFNSTVLVVVSIVVASAIISGLDYAFSNALMAIGKLI